MPEPTAPHAPAATQPQPALNGSAPPGRPAPAALRHRGLRTRISGVRVALIAGAAALVVVLIFIIQNAHAVSISFLGAHLHLSLTVALLFAAVAGALVMAATGTARITQLRQVMIQ